MISENHAKTLKMTSLIKIQSKSSETSTPEQKQGHLPWVVATSEEHALVVRLIILLWFGHLLAAKMQEPLNV